MVATARAVGISRRRLHYWVRATAAVRPRRVTYGVRHFYRFRPADVRTLQYLKRLVDQDGYTLQAAARLVCRSAPRR